MALLFCDGFGHQGAYSRLKYNGVSSLEYGDGWGRDGGWGARSKYTQYVDFDETKQTVIIGLAYKTTNFVAGEASCFLGVVHGSTIQIGLAGSATGFLYIYRGGTLIHNTTVGGYVANDVWVYIEMKVKVSNTVGTVEVRINGTTVIDLTDIDTSASNSEYATAARLATGFHGTPTSYYDDLYVCDDAGLVNNDFLGDVKVDVLYPTSDGNSSDFTPSTGVDNYATVDDPQLTGVTDYNDGITVGDKDTYGMTLFEGTGTILGVQACCSVFNDDQGGMHIRNICRSGTTPADNEGPSFGISQTMLGNTTVWEKEPTDDVAWTAAKINAAEFGIKVQS